jgi:transposase
MDSVSDDARGDGYRRIEVLTGPGRRRKWSDDDKARIVAETLGPGAVVTEVARRWQVSPQQVFGWRRQARVASAVAAAPAVPAFVPIVADASAAAPGAAASTAPARPVPSIEVKLAGNAKNASGAYAGFVPFFPAWRRDGETGRRVVSRVRAVQTARRSDAEYQRCCRGEALDAQS